MLAFLAIKQYIRFCSGTTHNLDSIYASLLRASDLQDALSYKTKAPPLCGRGEVPLKHFKVWAAISRQSQNCQLCDSYISKMLFSLTTSLALLAGVEGVKNTQRNLQARSNYSPVHARQLPANATGVKTITTPQNVTIRYKEPGE
jgi:hypothetical protein